jgi:hypothetical protein
MVGDGPTDQGKPNLFRHLFPPVPGHPIQTALRELLCRTWGSFIYSCERLPPGAESLGLGRDYREAFGQLFGELLEWVVATPFEPSIAIEDWSREAQKQSLGDQMFWVRPLLVDLGYGNLSSPRRRRGRPVERRQHAIHAFELHSANCKAWTWGKLARRFCNCSRGERLRDDHDHRCREKLNREVGHLKHLLDRLQIPYK